LLDFPTAPDNEEADKLAKSGATVAKITRREHREDLAVLQLPGPLLRYAPFHLDLVGVIQPL